ncbi:MAG: hypothetical protein HOY78_17155 [Saccharothrix sp.]|nr:hypothetical protein [Saccharothrix sp.]
MTKLTALAVTALSTFAFLTGDTTTTCPPGMRCGSYEISGLGTRKLQVRDAGATVLDLAVAMLETERMDTDYPYGDDKKDDAANFGIFKQNWFMLRNACAHFRDQSTNQWHNGATLNTDLATDLTCLHQSQDFYGLTTWFAGHRNGETGIKNPDTDDITTYKTAIHWIRTQLDTTPANLTNNTRFWVDVHPIALPQCRSSTLTRWSRAAAHAAGCGAAATAAPPAPAPARSTRTAARQPPPTPAA